MTGCALILVNICESDKYEGLHERFVEGRILPWALVTVESSQYLAVLEFQLLFELIERHCVNFH